MSQSLSLPRILQQLVAMNEHFAYLPDELWLQIFSKLSPYDWCHSLSGVSRRWRKMASDPWLWRRVDFGAHLGWTDFPIPFLKAKIPLTLSGNVDECQIHSLPSVTGSTTTGFVRPSCLVKALTKLHLAFPYVSVLQLSSVRLASDTRQCACAIHHGQERVDIRGSAEDVLAADAAGIAAVLAAFPRLRRVVLSLNLDLAAKFLSLPGSDPNAARLVDNLGSFDLHVGLW